MKVLVAYYSLTGNVHELAQAIAEGAKEAGAEVRIRQIREFTPALDVDKRSDLKKQKESMKAIEYATKEDLIWADGVAFGSPTRFGNMAPQLSQYLCEAHDLWLSGDLCGKPACAFTSSASQHSGQESTLLSMATALFHFGFTVLGLPVDEQLQHKMDYIHGCSPYGVSSVSGPENGLRPTEVDLALARAQGYRLATTAKAIQAAQKPSRDIAA